MPTKHAPTREERAIAAEVKALRARLEEDVATFAARFHRSARTVETWEQGSRRPDPMVLAAMRALAARLKPRAAAAAR